MSAASEWTESTRLVDRLLVEAQQLTAVDEFSAHHARLEHDASVYEALLPSSLPGAGEQYAFRVDLDACTGCKACVTACHSLNGLEEDEQWRRVGLLESESSTSSAVRPQTVTGACHHCEEPGCLAGCPVRAYEKDDVTGIVHHLDDQCIGCRYCQLMCPYDVPQYSERLGIVRKCDMCRGRLAEGEAPACVQGCPNGAISIGIVSPSAPETGAMLLDVAPGGMPASTLTRPTTTYVSQRPRKEGEGDRLASDLSDVRPAEGHTPLAIMLVLTQAAIGAIAADAIGVTFGAGAGYDAASAAIVTAFAALVGGVGLSASVAHLGRPQWAFRAILGLRTSWMSREIVTLGAFSGAMIASAALAALAAFVPTWTDANPLLGDVRAPVAWLATLCGGVGLACSVGIYAATGRPLWRVDRTALRFGGTTLWFAIAATWLGLAVSGSASATPPPATVPILLGLATGLRLALERGPLVRPNAAAEGIALERSRALIANRLRPLAVARVTLLSLAGVGLPALGLWVSHAAVPLAALGLGLTAELCERSLFFRAEAMPSMPGATWGRAG